MMPWLVAALLACGAGALLLKAWIDRSTGYDDPSNTLDDRFDHMMEPGSQRDHELRERRR